VTGGRLVVATGNAGKLREFVELLRPAGLVVEGLDVEVAEDADTYEGNASLKAVAAWRVSGGAAALGDDSGVEVPALGGFPGLRSARVAPTQPERNRLLLDRLAASGAPRPWAVRFVCALALALPGGEVCTFRAQVEGELVPPRDGGRGFGYDPMFLLPDLGLTFAQLPPAEKHRRSHRGRAVQALLASGVLDSLR
jgi:XTP/dITP diphosphohydrolase